MGYSWNEVGEADGKYFRYNGKYYLYHASTHQLIYEENPNPVTNAVRTDSRLDDSDKLKLYASTKKVKIYDQDYLPSGANELSIINDWSLSPIISNYIDINLGTYDSSKTVAFYITNYDNKVLLAFNKPSTTTTTQRIYLNGYRSRNKKIYN